MQPHVGAPRAASRVETRAVDMEQGPWTCLNVFCKLNLFHVTLSILSTPKEPIAWCFWAQCPETLGRTQTCRTELGGLRNGRCCAWAMERCFWRGRPPWSVRIRRVSTCCNISTSLHAETKALSWPLGSDGGPRHWSTGLGKRLSPTLDRSTNLQKIDIILKTYEYSTGNCRPI